MRVDARCLETSTTVDGFPPLNAAGLMNPVNFDSGMIHLYRLLGQIQ
jgi:hypothetical protein